MTSCKTCSTHINDCDILDEFECAACLRKQLAAAQATLANYDEIARRMAKVLLDTPMPSTVRSLPVLGTVTDDGCVLWNGGD